MYRSKTISNSKRLKYKIFLYWNRKAHIVPRVVLEGGDVKKKFTFRHPFSVFESGFGLKFRLVFCYGIFHVLFGL